MPVTPEMEDLILEAIAADRADIYTAIPGKVESYDADSGLCDVRPQISQIIDDEREQKQTEALPLLRAVPVEFPGAGNVSIEFPIETGTTGVIEFCVNNIGEWINQGSLVDPGDRRLHGLSGAVFRPGLRHSRNQSGVGSTDALTLSGPKVRLGSKDASNPAVLFDQLKDLFVQHKHPTPAGISSPPDNALQFDTAKSGVVFLE